MPEQDVLANTWSVAFARQALADLDVRDLLARNNAPPFARLHYLQMAAEKLCKAYLVEANGYELLKFSHCIL